MTQADSWEGVTRRIDEQAGKYKDLYTGSEDILFTGCGSAFNISYAVAPFFQKLSGKTCRPVHASDLMINPELFLNGNRPTLVVGFSRSGETTESLAALETARKTGAATIAVVCFAQSRMANIADATLVLEEAAQVAVAWIFQDGAVAVVAGGPVAVAYPAKAQSTVSAYRPQVGGCYVQGHPGEAHLPKIIVQKETKYILR